MEEEKKKAYSEVVEILKSDLKLFSRIKQHVLKLLKLLFRVKNTEKEIN